MSEEVSYTISLPGSSKNFKAFRDDTIETVRMKIGIAVGAHPDRMRIYVQYELPEDYYHKDSRKWESLFLRMSPDGKPIKKESLSILDDNTEPAWEFPEEEYDKASWMMLDNKRRTSFIELRILGASEDTSWIYPLNNRDDPPFTPPVSKIGIEYKSLFQTVHPLNVSGFKVLLHDDTVRPQLELLYYPFLRSGSPTVVPDEIIRSILKQTVLLNALYERKPTQASDESIMRVRWKLPLVNTDFGLAVRNKFEQIFYGTTVSKHVPAISFFGSNQEQSRHKFFTNQQNPKTPTLDLRTWQYWWTATKPTKNSPAIIFYKGHSRFDYDRVTVTSTHMIISCQRPETSDETLEHLQKKVKSFIESIDGLYVFLDEKDLDYSRWVVQDLAVSLKYSKEMKEVDFRRFDCLRTIYEVMDSSKLVFKLLRADQTDSGLSPQELRVMGILRDNEYTSSDEIAEQLEISSSEAETLLSTVKDKISENPDIIDKQYSNLPTFKFSATTAIVTYALDVERVSRYVSSLRDILMNANDSSLDKICPARMETVERAVAETVETTDLNDSDLSFLDDLLAEISNVGVVAGPETRNEEVAAPQKKRVATKGNLNLTTYMLTQLREFDPETYDPDDPQILRKCDKPRQPIVLTPGDIEKLDNTPYDPRNLGDGYILELTDPDGNVICPAFWCTHDRIPLTEEQLGPEKKCPVCDGKVRSQNKAVEKTQDVVEFPVIERDSNIAYPGFVKYKSKKNGKNIPCCFTTRQHAKLTNTRETPTVAEAYYVLGETKTKLDSLRLGYIPKILGKVLKIPINYSETIEAGNRIQTGQTGFYRVGIGHAAQTLPSVLHFGGSIKSPKVNVDVTMRCSFFRTWKGAEELGDPSIVPSSYSFREQLAGRIESIDKAFQQKTLSPLEELEYCALSLDCQMFVIYVSDVVKIGCFMNNTAIRSVNRAILVMVSDTNLDYIAHVARISAIPKITANLHTSSLFPSVILEKLNEMQSKACISNVPTVDDVVAVINSLGSLKNKIPEMKVILDPYGRAQAVFIPELILLPFKPTSHIPIMFNKRVSGFSDISEEELPYKDDMLEFLEEGERVNPGFKYVHDISDRNGRVVEMVTVSGLRIPIQSWDESNKKDEVIQTITKHGEESLVWGEESSKVSKAISYEAEVFDFLLYQLSYDIQNGEDYGTLRDAITNNTAQLKPRLHEWFDDTVTFTNASEPPSFVQKIRSPCTEKSCDGNLCAWDGSSCRVEIKKIKPSLDHNRLLGRLYSTISSNEKIRDIVWQYRTSPFFSSILYFELPTELIVSDSDITKRLRS